MLKIYFESCLIWFLIMISEGIIFKKEFIMARNQIRKETNDNSKIYGNILTTFYYFLISLIPIYRLIFLIGKIYMTFHSEKMINIIKKQQKSKKEKRDKQ